MPTRLTREERKAETRERLLEAAAQVFARRGYQRASVDEIADEAGFSSGALYSNFAGKEDLFLALFERVIAEQVAGLADAVAGLPTVDARARGGAREWMAFLDREPELVLLFMEFWSFAMRDPEVRPRLAARYADVRERIGLLIEDGMRELGLELTLPVAQLATAIDALADGLAFQRLADRHAVPDELFGNVLAALFAGAVRPAGAR